jgi:hypothetical protein
MITVNAPSNSFAITWEITVLPTPGEPANRTPRRTPNPNFVMRLRRVVTAAMFRSISDHTDAQSGLAGAAL